MEGKRAVIAVLQQAINKHQNELRELLKNCTHDEVERKSMYFEGSYYDKSHTEYRNECKLCGARSEKAVESHGYYG